MNVPAYRYACNLVNVHDGDTVTVDIDLGMATWRLHEHVRLHGVNAPELNTDAGKVAQAFAASWFAAGKAFVVDTFKDADDKYGRLLGVFWRDADTVSLNDALLASSNAIPYMTGSP